MNDELNKTLHAHVCATIRRPGLSDNNSTPAGSFTGNGDMCIILGNCYKGADLFVAKSDFWKAVAGNDSDGGIKPIARLEFLFSTDTYYAEQRMDEAEIICRRDAYELRALTCATENTALIEITSPKAVEYVLEACSGSCSENNSGENEGLLWVSRAFTGDELKFESKAAVCLKKISEEQVDENTVVTRFALTVSTNSGCESPAADAFNRAQNAEFDLLQKAHRAWWSAFWAKSAVEFDDKQLELNWYASLYTSACCMRGGCFAPGLYGNFITTDSVGWHGDYHLNYNYQAPFFALFSSNHTELSDCYLTPLEEFMPQAQRFAKEFLGCRGVYYPVGIGPKGLNTSEADYSLEHGQLFLGQKSDAAYAAVIPIMRWYATYDKAYAAEHIYPFVCAVGDFWEDYLKLENGRYVIYNDAVHEVRYYDKSFNPAREKSGADDFNCLLSLGLVRMVFKALLDMSAELGVDENRREKRQHILDHISEFPTYKRLFSRIFRLTERGTAFNPRNSLCIQHIYPAGQIGFSSPDLLKATAVSTYNYTDRSLDDNGSCTYLPCGARLGIEPALLIDALKQNYDRFQLPNMLFLHEGGCLEHSATTAATLNEMLLQSYEGFIRVFPVWDTAERAAFTSLRADGAFLVSASAENCEISPVEIISEQGRACRVLNPYSTPAAVKNSAGEQLAGAGVGEMLEFATEKGQKYTVTKC